MEFWKKNKKCLLFSTLAILILLTLIVILWLIFGRSSAINAEDLKFNRQCIETHDKLRKKHRAGSLKFSPELFEIASTRAAKLVELDQMIHLPDENGYGENIHMIYGALSSCEEVTQSWYDEFTEYNYDFKNPKFNYQTGHATQVVWAGSGEIGCAQKNFMKNSRPKQYTICLYNPAGNIIGRFKENVFPPMS